MCVCVGGESLISHIFVIQFLIMSIISHVHVYVCLCVCVCNFWTMKRAWVFESLLLPTEVGMGPRQGQPGLWDHGCGLGSCSLRGNSFRHTHGMTWPWDRGWAELGGDISVWVSPAQQGPMLGRAGLCSRAGDQHCGSVAAAGTGRPGLNWNGVLSPQAFSS